MTFDEVVQRFPLTERASQPDTAHWLGRQVRELALRFEVVSPICIEVGSWCGFTTVTMAAAGGLVIAVDTFDGRDAQTRDRAVELWLTGSPLLERFVANGLALGSGRIIGLVGQSPEIADRLPLGCAHLIFIDGDHELESVRADLAAWGKRVKAGGVLCGHDFSQETVKVAVEEYVVQHGWGPIVTEADQLWWFRRPM